VINALRNKEHDLQSVVLGRTAFASDVSQQTSVSPSLSASRLVAEQEALISPASVSLQDAIESYLDEVRRFRSPKTIAACEHMLNLFGSRLPGRSVKDISREDLLDHMSVLNEKGLGDRTIYNHIMRIGTLLKSHGVVGLLSAADKPQYDEKDVEAYNSDQLASLFAAANSEERILFEFFLGTGFREQEVMYTTWKNVDFKGKVISVRSKPEIGFRIKDKEERSAPVPDSLIASLENRKIKSASMLVFPGTNGKPNGHFLRVLQKLALRAGLNCRECVTRRGQNCATHPVCGEWGLHKFRKTFATMHSDAGVQVALSVDEEPPESGGALRNGLAGSGAGRGPGIAAAILKPIACSIRKVGSGGTGCQEQTLAAIPLSRLIGILKERERQPTTPVCGSSLLQGPQFVHPSG